MEKSDRKKARQREKREESFCNSRKKGFAAKEEGSRRKAREIYRTSKEEDKKKGQKPKLNREGQEASPLIRGRNPAPKCRSGTDT